MSYVILGGNPLSFIDPFGLAKNGGDGSSSGINTANPYKHCKEDPRDPNFIICKRKKDGKKIGKRKPADWPSDTTKFSCDDDCPEKLIVTTVVVGGVSYLIWKTFKVCGCTLIAGPAGGLVCLFTP